ncbi:XdhC family protein, partial [Enterococcus faecalis]|uniref:XdhC family protein n=1 Tax=Enterococcus faecalis TaxID=1351 RepID=UPI0010039158
TISGSTPRSQGARMLVSAEGRIAGTVGGGAVEFQAEQVAKSLGKPRVIAEEILKEQGIELTERKIENNGWQEIPAATPAYDHPYEEESEFYYDNDS